MSELYMIVLQGKEELGNDPEAIRLWAELSGVDIDSITEDTPFDIDVADRLLRSLPEVIERMREKSRKDVESLEERLKKVLESKQEKSEADELLEKLDKELAETPIFSEEKVEREVEEPAQKPQIELPAEPLFATTEESPEETGEQEVKAEQEAPRPEPAVEEVAAPEKAPEREYEVVKEPVAVSVPDMLALFRIEGNRIVALKGDWSDRYGFLLPVVSSGAVRRLFVVLKNGNTLYGEGTDSGYVFAEFEERNLGIVRLLFSRVMKDLSSR